MGRRGWSTTNDRVASPRPVSWPVVTVMAGRVVPRFHSLVAAERREWWMSRRS